MKHKSFFPVALGNGYRLDVRNGRIIVEERGLLRFWKWKVVISEPITDTEDCFKKMVEETFAELFAK